MHTEKVKSNEKRPENKLGCALCISFQYKIKRKFEPQSVKTSLNDI